ncbi:hypothetical protein, partial [Ursidibacter maritimus]
MKKILILYPEQFKSESKFNRKLDIILSRSKELILVALEDKNKLIERYSSVRGYS